MTGEAEQFAHYYVDEEGVAVNDLLPAIDEGDQPGRVDDVDLLGRQEHGEDWQIGSFPV